MKHILFALFALVLMACAPTNSAPTVVAEQPTVAPTVSQEPTRALPTATTVLLTDTPTAVIIPTETPTLTDSPVPARTATFQAVATIWASYEGKCKVVDALSRLPSTKGKIAFVSNRDGTPEVFVMSSDGSEMARVTTLCNPASLSWFPEGKRLAFTCMGDEVYSRQICVLDFEQLSITRITNLPKPKKFEHIILELAVSPDGKKILFSSNHDGIGSEDSALYTIDIDGINLTRLTQGVWYNSAPSWSHDGKRIAFARGRGFKANQNLVVMDSDGSNLKTLFECNVNLYPTWSIDDKKIFYSSNCPLLGPASYGIHVRSVSASTTANATVLRGGKDADLAYFNLSLSPDGKSMAFVAGRSSFHESNIFVMSVDGKVIKKLTDDGHYYFDSAWSPAK